MTENIKRQLDKVHYDPITGEFRKASGFIYNPAIDYFRFGSFYYPKANAAAYLTLRDVRYFNGPFTELPFADRFPVRLKDPTITGHACYALRNIDMLANFNAGAICLNGIWLPINFDLDNLTFTLKEYKK